MQAEYLNERQVSQMTGISLAKLRNDRFFHRGIPYYKIGRSVRYAQADIQKYLEDCRVEVLN